MPSPALPRIVAISTHIYSRVLWLCPRHYRREYGAPMAQAFRDLCCDAYQWAERNRSASNLGSARAW